MFDQVVILQGEITHLSLLGFKELIMQLLSGFVQLINNMTWYLLTSLLSCFIFNFSREVTFSRISR